LLPDNSLITGIKVPITDALHAYIPLQPAVKSSQPQDFITNWKSKENKFCLKVGGQIRDKWYIYFLKKLVFFDAKIGIIF
jgi:hypothetical protein